MMTNQEKVKDISNMALLKITWEDYKEAARIKLKETYPNIPVIDPKPEEFVRTNGYQEESSICETPDCVYIDLTKEK
jgi:hypothetical protein